MAPSNLRIISANCQGLRDINKRTDVLNYFRDIEPDILCLQDTHWLSADEKLIKTLWAGECLLNGSQTNARGVAILINKTFEYKIASVERDMIGNLISVSLILNEFTIQIINIYAPNKDSPNFFKSLKEKIELSPSDYCIVCGDFNLVIDPKKDSYNYRHINNPQSRNCLIDTMNSLGLKDAFRFINNDARCYTWHKKNPVKRARLDYFIISENFTDRIEKCNVKPGYRSDHSYIELLVTLCKFERGKGLWKFNCSLLKDKEYLITVNNIIDREKLRYALPVYNPDNITNLQDSSIEFTIPDSDFLEVLLLQIRGETIRYASSLKKKTIRKEENLKQEIENMEKDLDSTNPVHLDLKKKELENIRKDKLNGIMIRSRAQWLSEGEKPSKYFCSLEKFYYTEKTVKRVVTDDGSVITNQKDILNELKNYYQNLFKSKDAELQDCNISDLQSLRGFKKLSSNDANSLEGCLTINEISEALRKMKNQKCPGIDGFPAEFFKVFWIKLKFFVLRSLNCAYNTGQMSISLRQCIISCLPKGDKPRQFLKNWRPISLLSVVYKIASSALATRLRTVLHTIISNTQSGFMSNRFIGENTRLIYDIIHYTNYNKLPGLLMLIDFQKAFDSVSWKFLFSILTAFGFKESFCKWIEVLNVNVSASILQCGKLSDFFRIERGCRQGDPISPYLFIICAQIMYLLIINEKCLRGISVNNNEFKITQFADDTTLILDGSKNSLLAALNVLEVYGTMSGLKVNIDKTKLVWIGKKRHSKDKFDVGKDLVWGTSSFTLLGINFSVDLTNMIEINYIPAINSIEKLLNLWRHRYLTPIGKITVIKSLALSKLNHLFMALPSPGKEILKQLEIKFYKFIWSGKPDKIKRNILTKHYTDGGLSMIELDTFISAIKITWIRRLYQNSDTQWAMLAKAYLGSVKKTVLLGSCYSSIIARKLSNKFWSETLFCWSKLTDSIPTRYASEALSVPLWNNPKVSKTNFFLPEWYNKGIISIADMISGNGNLIIQNDLTTGYHIRTNFLEYHRVTVCVKNYLSKQNDISKTHNKPTIPNQIKIICKSKKGSQDFYKILVNQNIVDDTTYYSFWEQSLGITINKNMWKQIFRVCFKTVKNNDLIWMQYRVIYRILGTNDLLYKINKHDDGKCSFCKEHTETILHLFVQCTDVQNFWSELKLNIQPILGVNLDINPTTIILGNLQTRTDTIPLNTIYFAAKLYIFRMSKSNKCLNYPAFCKFFKTVYLEQELVAKLELNESKFKKIWGNFIQMFLC